MTDTFTDKVLGWLEQKMICPYCKLPWDKTLPHDANGIHHCEVKRGDQ